MWKIKSSSCMADIIECQTKRMQDALDSLQSKDTMKNMLRDLIKSNRRRKPLKKETNRLSSMLTGRCWTVFEGKLLLTVTNLPQLSYLDLPEYSIDCVKLSTETDTLSIILERNEMVELDPVALRFDTDSAHSGLLSDMKEICYREVGKNLQLEWLYVSQLNMLGGDWDLEKFQSVLDVLEELPPELDEIMLATMPARCRILMDHCRDSEYVTGYLGFVTKRFTVEKVLKRLSHHFLDFFMVHVARHFQVHPEPKKFLQWIMDLRLVDWSLSRGLPKHLHRLLAFGWPYVYAEHETRAQSERLADRRVQMRRQILEELSVEEDTSKPWHGSVKKMFCSHSYWSPTYMVLFIAVLFSNTNSNRASKEYFAECIRLMWRAVPTPLVTADDMGELLKKMAQNNLYANNASIFLSWRQGKKRFLEMYPKELLIPYQPRSLLHLSRCEVRKHLEFTVNAEKLPIPSELKSYLNLEW